MTTERTIPLNQLVHSDANVRRTGKTEGIAELAASIAAHGLRQNLNVLPRGDGKSYEVVAGARRLRALKQLAKSGQLAKNAPIQCLVLEEGDDAAEISLAENAMRISMHPDDQCDAFRAMIEERGASLEDVAARFGVTTAVVRQRLKLASVSPKLRMLYRKGEMSTEHVMALAIHDDHAAQEQAWADLPSWNRDPETLKRALTHDSVAVTDKLARFIGIAAYEAAGGAVLRDLFDAEDEGYLADGALVQQLAATKMAETVTTLEAEGWKWVKPELSRDYSTPYERIYPHGDDPHGEGADGDGTDGEGEDSDANAGTVPMAEPHFTAEDKARAGVRVTLAHDGSVQIERGFIHPDDAKAGKRTKVSTKPNADPAAMAATMVEELTAHRTAALRIELARNPATALAVTVHALALETLYRGSHASCLAIRAESEPLDRHADATGDSPAHQAMAEEGACWGDRLPGDPDDLFAWCLHQSQDVLLDLLAYVAALTLDAVQAKHRPAHGLDHADQLAGILGLDMTQWWTPSAEGFYERLPKATLIHIVTEAKAPISVSIGALKKPEAARYVAKAMAATGWLPEPLRSPKPAQVLVADAA